ncbi:hypothetical protein ES703_14323 [subsurface metagenome]
MDLPIDQVVCGDALKELKAFPDKSVDLIFADPPFNAKKGMGTLSHRYLADIDNRTDSEYKAFCQAWFEEARRIGKRILLTPGIKHTHNYPQPLWTIAIEQPAAVKFSVFGGFNVWEPLFVYDRPVKRVPRDMVRYHCRNLEKGVWIDHPCPDNIDMLRWIIGTWSRANDIVLDPFAGTGTTLIATKEQGRRFIGIEIIPQYCNISKQRLAQQVIPTERMVNDV